MIDTSVLRENDIRGVYGKNITEELNNLENSIKKLENEEIGLKENLDYTLEKTKTIKDGIKELACCSSKIESLPLKTACCPSNKVFWLKACLRESSSLAKSVAST